MLTAAQEKLIWESGYCTYHDYRTLSVSDGEPFLDDGLLYYFDGRKLFLCGYPVDRNTLDLTKRLKAAVGRCWMKHTIEILSYCGPQSVSFREVLPRKVRLIASKAADPIKAEMVMDCSRPLPPSRLRRWLRSRRAASFTVRESAGSNFVLSAYHFSLIERFFGARDLSPYLLDLAFVLPVVARMKHVSWLEAFQGDRLCGIAAVIDAFCNTDLAIILCTDPTENGTSDRLYAAMRESSQRRMKRYLNLGPSPSSGHYRFKQKWSAEGLVTPYSYFEWGFGELARGDYVSWPSRLIQYGFRPSEVGAGLRKLKEDAG